MVGYCGMGQDGMDSTTVLDPNLFDFGSGVATYGMDTTPGTPVYGGGTTSAPAQGTTNSWLAALTKAFGTAGSILGTRYAVPQLNPGQLIQTGPGGQSIMYQGTAGNMSLPSLGTFGSIGGASLLPLLLIGGLAVLVISRGK
jgi:hypothetical protein